MRIAIIAVAMCLLAACGGKESQAVAACEKEIATKMGDKKYVVDSKDMSANAANEEGDIIRIQSIITVDPGLPREDKQTFECRVRFTDGRADVISMSFTW
ncbi:hypothetical protein [Pseudomarimonas arenosa]|uniref:Uncharacterized protein n=1 Tax=Pseudomarimonas arenosa TaxID=2774145 RepID=A0AAW3ZLP2_9GAMM|nr:hypothetical protein [Pseudomarimonas arenosa]MBD8526966.1 hypothetical protein [Pseudomarimonas arenosa]